MHEPEFNISVLKHFVFSIFLMISAAMAGCSSAVNNQTDWQPAEDFLMDLQALSGIENAEIREAAADSIWNRLIESDNIPYTSDSTAVFLYRGEADQVAWNGDFNGWSGDTDYNSEGRRIPGTQIWYWKQTFPSDARLDYKITIDGTDWILDPHNPHLQYSGFGPNSELRMPDWVDEPLITPISGAPQGTLSEYRIMNSESLGYDLRYRVYTPAGYESLANVPVIYITDGQEYADPQLGAAPIVLDNLIYQQRIEPVLAVFVDPLDPANDNINRRTTEFDVDSTYLRFYADELIPEIERAYKTSGDPEDRAILGTSLGGLNATYFGFTRPDLFAMIGIQAPAYWYAEQIYDIVRGSEARPEAIYMSVGTIGDNIGDARTMKNIFEQKNLDFTYQEVPQGHSWGAWSSQMDDIFLLFFGS